MVRVVVVVVAALAAFVGCTKPSDRFTGEGEGEGAAGVTSPCDGVELFVQSDLSNDTVDAALPIDSQGAPLVMFGDTADEGASFASLKGFFEVSGYAANQNVDVQIVDHGATDTCASSGCPTTIGFRFFETVNVKNTTDGTCGASTVTADGDGLLSFRATGGGNGDGTGSGGGGGGGGGGANGPDVGIQLTPQ